MLSSGGRSRVETLWYKKSCFQTLAKMFIIGFELVVREKQQFRDVYWCLQLIIFPIDGRMFFSLKPKVMSSHEAVTRERFAFLLEQILEKKSKNLSKIAASDFPVWSTGCFSSTAAVKWTDWNITGSFTKYFFTGTKKTFSFLFCVFCFPSQEKQYVGFATLPNQVHRKSVKKGFDFTLMVAGQFEYLSSLHWWTRY